MMKPTSMTIAATSCAMYAIATRDALNDLGNHSGTPDSAKSSALATIVQKYAFCPALKKSTYAGSRGCVFPTYSRIRHIQRLSSAFQDIGCHQLKIWSAKAITNPRLNHGCRSRVMAPPPKIGVSSRKSHGV